MYRELEMMADVVVKVLVAFGRDDPLLPDFKQILMEGIGNAKEKSVIRPEGLWIDGAGHYPMEEKPETCARLILEFLKQNGGVGMTEG